MLDRCLAEFQDDSVQLVTAVSRVSERLHDLSRQAAGKAHSNLGLVDNAASGAVPVEENVRSVALRSGRLGVSIAKTEESRGGKGGVRTVRTRRAQEH